MLTGTTEREPRAISEREARRIREVAKALLGAMQEQGHICVHGEDWGRVKGGMATLESGMANLCDKVDSLSNEVAQARGEKKIVVAAIGFAASIIGAVIGALGVIFGR